MSDERVMYRRVLGGFEILGPLEEGPRFAKHDAGLPGPRRRILATVHGEDLEHVARQIVATLATPAAGEDVRERVAEVLRRRLYDDGCEYTEGDFAACPDGGLVTLDEWCTPCLTAALLRTPRGEGEAVAEIETWDSRGPDGEWGYEIRVLDTERLAALPAGRHPLYLSPALRSEAPDAPRGEGGAAPEAWKVEWYVDGVLADLFFKTGSESDTRVVRRIAASSRPDSHYEITPLYRAAPRSEAPGEAKAVRDVGYMLGTLQAAERMFDCGVGVHAAELVDELMDGFGGDRVRGLAHEQSVEIDWAEVNRIRAARRGEGGGE